MDKNIAYKMAKFLNQNEAMQKLNPLQTAYLKVRPTISTTWINESWAH